MYLYHMYTEESMGGKRGRERERELCDIGDTLCPLERVEYGNVLLQVRYGMCRATHRKLCIYFEHLDSTPMLWLHGLQDGNRSQ